MRGRRERERRPEGGSVDEASVVDEREEQGGRRKRGNRDAGERGLEVGGR